VVAEPGHVDARLADQVVVAVRRQGEAALTAAGVDRLVDHGSSATELPGGDVAGAAGGRAPLAGPDFLLGAGLLDQTLGPAGALTPRDHPAHDCG
jgi:hypothetical protein